MLVISMLLSSIDSALSVMLCKRCFRTWKTRCWNSQLVQSCILWTNYDKLWACATTVLTWETWSVI